MAPRERDDDNASRRMSGSPHLLSHPVALGGNAADDREEPRHSLSSFREWATIAESVR